MDNEFLDPDLQKFEANGVSLPPTKDTGYVENDVARICYAAYGSGSPVILLHGGLGHSGNWGHQIAPLVENGYRVVVIDSRCHGRSTHDEKAFSYELMASDVVAVMDSLQISKAAFVGWSDGACTALVLAANRPERVAGVFFFACNMDPSGTKLFENTPVLDRCFTRHKKDYAELSHTPELFESFAAELGVMQRTQPNYSAGDLAKIRVPVLIVQSEYDEFIKPEHAQYLAQTIPHADYVFLEGVSHFAPLQRPRQFNEAILKFLRRINLTTTHESTS